MYIFGEICLVLYQVSYMKKKRLLETYVVKGFM